MVVGSDLACDLHLPAVEWGQSKIVLFIIYIHNVYASCIGRFVFEVGQTGIGGLFTWTATSDAFDWRVHRRLRAQLDSL